MVEKKKAVILGSAGMKGMKYIEVLNKHPFIEIVQLCDPNPSAPTLGAVKNWFSLMNFNTTQSMRPVHKNNISA